MNGFLFTPEGGVIAVVSLLMSLMSVLVRKKLVNQELMKTQRGEMKELNKKIKEAQKAGDAKLVSEHTGRLMELNSQMMKQSFKPMLITLIPFLLVFNWMGGSFDHTMKDVALVYPIQSGVAVRDVVMSDGGIFNQTSSMMIWKNFTVEPGNWSTRNAEYTSDAAVSPANASLYYNTPKDALRGPFESNLTDGLVFLSSVENSGGKTRVTLFYNNTKSNIVARLGGYSLGWLGWYILCSMVTSIALNKIFKVS